VKTGRVYGSRAIHSKVTTTVMVAGGGLGVY